MTDDADSARPGAPEPRELEYERELRRIASLDLTYGEKIALSGEAMSRLHPDPMVGLGDAADDITGRPCDHCGRPIEGGAIRGPVGTLCLVVGEALPTCYDLVRTWGEPLGFRRSAG